VKELQPAQLYDENNQTLVSRLRSLRGGVDCESVFMNEPTATEIKARKKEVYSEFASKVSAALRGGYFWCLGCSHIVEPKNCGEPHQECPDCGSHRICWHPPTLTTAEV